VLFELFTVLACRSQIHSYFKLGIRSNMWLIYANLSSFALLLAVIYVPVLQEPFHVVPIGWEDWRFVIPASLTGFITVELIKVYNRRKRQAQSPRTATT